MQATTAVHAKTYQDALKKASDQFMVFYGDKHPWKIVDYRATAVGTVAGEVIAWDVIFEAESKT
jgi:hypothetical protein